MYFYTRVKLKCSKIRKKCHFRKSHCLFWYHLRIGGIAIVTIKIGNISIHLKIKIVLDLSKCTKIYSIPQNRILSLTQYFSSINKCSSKLGQKVSIIICKLQQTLRNILDFVFLRKTLGNSVKNFEIVGKKSIFDFFHCNALFCWRCSTADAWGDCNCVCVMPMRTRDMRTHSRS